MSSENKTPNLGLNQWQGNEYAKRLDFVDDNLIIDTEIKKLKDEKVDKVTGKGLSTNDYTDSEKSKLAGVENEANKYIHPSSHPASIITETTSKKFVSDNEKATWNNKVDKVSGKGLSTNDYTNAEKSKLSGIATEANNYTHPTKHPPSIITQDSNNRFTTDAEKKVWNTLNENHVGENLARGTSSEWKSIDMFNRLYNLGGFPIDYMGYSIGQKITISIEFQGLSFFTEPDDFSMYVDFRNANDSAIGDTGMIWPRVDGLKSITVSVPAGTSTFEVYLSTRYTYGEGIITAKYRNFKVELGDRVTPYRHTPVWFADYEEWPDE